MNKIIVPAEHMRAIKPWQTIQYRIESWLAQNGWPFRNYDLTNRGEALSTSLDRSKLSIRHFPDQSVEVRYDGEFVSGR